MSLSVIVLGGGGHAKVLIDALHAQSIKVLGFTDVQSNHKLSILGSEALGADDVVLTYATEHVQLVNGLGSIGAPMARKRLYEQFKKRGYRFANVIHPSAIIGAEVDLAEGIQVMAGAVIQVGCHIGETTMINTRATIDHDCQVGAHVHVAPGVTLSGGVTVENGVHIGTGATVIQGIRIGKNSIIGAGAVVINDVKEGTTVVGVPAREV
jgi:sugar O-acyltransferase (sialic acid O-acetyltransferase NeuD family)